MANIYLNGDENFAKAEEEIDMIMGCEQTSEFPSCKTFYLRAQARFKQKKFMDALLDIEDADKLKPKNLELKAIQQLKLDINNAFYGEKPGGKEE